jgi:hypothetical protein
MGVRNWRFGTAALIVACSPSWPGAANRQPEAPPAQPVPAVAGILDAFAQHAVVALGEGPHGNEPGHRFRISLIRDPRFAATVNDIVVEFGNARYQALMDRHIAGEDVPRNDLREVWQNTTVPGPTWDLPIYEEFFREVRSVNAALPPSQRLRVLLGDAPIDWTAVRGPADVHRFSIQKDRHAGSVVKREVLARKRRALVIFGDGHLQGRGFAPASLTNVLERSPSATKVFTISASAAPLAKMQPDVTGWDVPSLAHLRGTVLGRQPYARFYPLPPAAGWSTVLMQDQFDAVLYLGPGDGARRPPFPVALCDDAAYIAMRFERLALAGGPVAEASADLIRRVCGTRR